MPYLLYLSLGLAPSLIWLAFFLRKDAHPESKRAITRIFLWGALATLPALATELGIDKLVNLSPIALPHILVIIITVFIGVALVEEFFKYLVVKWRAIPSREFDEPIDAMIYMITAAMGFAAVENIFLFFTPGVFEAGLGPWEFALLRFLGPTLLHALASATVGFFIAASILRAKYHNEFLILGLLIAAALHGLFNLAIIEVPDNFKLSLITAVLATLALFVTWSLSELKRLKAICLPKSA